MSVTVWIGGCMWRGRFEEETSPKRRLSLLRGEKPTEEGGMQQRVVKTHTNSPKIIKKGDNAFTAQ